jgi:phospholipase/carboxylesterase
MNDDQGLPLKIGQGFVRQRLPVGGPVSRLMVLLHGWTGDEHSMMVFTGRLPQEAWIASPRGLHPAPQGGYSWYAPREFGSWPGLDVFIPAVEFLSGWINSENFPDVDLNQIDLVGFSQGAALAYTFALLHPERVRAVAGLAGFLPEGVVRYLGTDKPLYGKPVFVTHGSLDSIVPVAMARRGVDILQQAGADVTFCEDEVGHKLSANCFASLQVFWNNLYKK